MTIDEELQLVRQAKENLEAFEALYDLYLPKVYGFVMGKVRRQHTTEDLVSEIFIKILDGLPKYEFRGLPFGAWVFQIARNHLRDYYAKASRMNVAQIEDVSWVQDEDEWSDPSKRLQQKSDRARIENLLSELTEQEAEIVRLKYFSELSNKEIADTLCLSANHVGVILYRSLKKLKTFL